MKIEPKDINGKTILSVKSEWQNREAFCTLVDHVREAYSITSKRLTLAETSKLFGKAGTENDGRSLGRQLSGERPYSFCEFEQAHNLSLRNSLRIGRTYGKSEALKFYAELAKSDPRIASRLNFESEFEREGRK